MTPVLIVLALVASGGAVVANAAREPRLITLGVLVTLLASGYVSDPLPGMVALGGRLVGAVLGGYLLWIALRRAPLPAVTSQAGWAGAASIGAVAFASGWLGAAGIGEALRSVSGEGPTIGLLAPGLVDGSLVAQAAVGSAFAIAALAAGGLLLARDVLRLGIGSLLAVAAAERLLVAIDAPLDDLVVLAFGLVYAAGGAAVAGLIHRAIRDQGDLELRGPSSRDIAVRSRGSDEAHPVGLGRRR
jgi:hypothetical protein